MEIFDFEELRFSKVELPARLWKVLHDQTLQKLIVVCRNTMPERAQILVFNHIDTEPFHIHFPTEIPNWTEVMVAENGQLFLHQFAGEKDPTLEGTWVWDFGSSSTPQFFKNQVFSSLPMDKNTLEHPIKKGQFLSIHTPEYYSADSPYFESITRLILQNQTLAELNTQSFGYFEFESGFVLGWRTEDGVVHFATQHSGQADRKMIFSSFEGEKNLSYSFWFVLTNLGIWFASGPQTLIFAHRKF